MFNEALPHAVAADGEVGVALGAALGEVAGDGLRLRSMPTMAPRFASAITLLAISAVPAPGATETRDADVGLAHDIAGGGDVAQVVAPAEHDAGGRRVLDHVAGDRGVGLDRDADAGAVARIGAGRPLRAAGCG